MAAISKKVNAVIDNHQEIVHPLDYSFKALGEFADLLREKPRQRDGTALLDLEEGDIDPDSAVELVKSNSTALKLNNNMLANWDGFIDTLQALFLDPAITLQWVDLSFNDIKTIDKALLQLPNLTMLYLHGNNIRRGSEIDKLSELCRLRSLTLHGNPVESLDGYKFYVLTQIPQLMNIDFSAVTKQDRKSVEIWNKANPSATKSSKYK